MTVAVLALLFSLLFIWYSRNTSESAWLYWAPYLMAAAAFALGIPVYKAARADGHPRRRDALPLSALPGSAAPARQRTEERRIGSPAPALA